MPMLGTVGQLGSDCSMLAKLKRTVAAACLLATACFVILWMSLEP